MNNFINADSGLLLAISCLAHSILYILQSTFSSVRESATKAHHYDYATTHHSIENKFQAVFDGKPPYSWQTDVTEALLLRLDCIVIAGMGSGKTMPFGMPLLLEEAKDKIIVVISPLNELEAEQVSVLISEGFSHCLPFLRLKGFINLALQQLLSMLKFIVNNYIRYVSTMLQVYIIFTILAYRKSRNINTEFF
jgi:hypothetical protein